MFDLRNESEGHELQQLRWCQSMANVDLCKSHMTHFVIALTVSEMFQTGDLENLGPSRGVQHSAMATTTKATLENFFC